MVSILLVKNCSYLGFVLGNHIFVVAIFLKIIQRFSEKLTSDNIIFISLGLSIVANVKILEMRVVGSGISGPSITGLPSSEILYLYGFGIFVLPCIFYFSFIRPSKQNASCEPNESKIDDE